MDNIQWNENQDQLVGILPEQVDLQPYQLDLLQAAPPEALLVPRILAAYDPPWLLYIRSSLTPILQEKPSFCSYVNILNAYCNCRRVLESSLLDFRCIELDEKLIYVETEKQASIKGRGVIYEEEIRFLYLPLAQGSIKGENEVPLTEARTDSYEVQPISDPLLERHLNQLGKLTEACVLAGQSEQLLSETDALAMLDRFYNDFSQFQTLCLRLLGELPSAPKSIAAVKRRFEQRPKQAEASAAPTIIMLLLLCLLAGNLILRLAVFSSSPLRLPVALVFFSAAALLAALALWHPRSPLKVKQTRFQNEQELHTNLFEETDSKLPNSLNLPHEQPLMDEPPHQAMLYPVSSGSSGRLRSSSQLSDIKAYLTLGGGQLLLGSDPAQADLALQVDGEPALHCAFKAYGQRACIVALSDNKCWDIAIDGRVVTRQQEELLPDHCIIRIGSVYFEYVRDKCQD